MQYPQLLRQNDSADKIQHMDIETWINRVIGDDSRRTAAKKIDVNDSTISRQISRTHTLSPEVVIALCREYGYSPADGLVETGHLEPNEIEGAGVSEALGYATNEQILEEMMRRVDPQAVRLFQGDEDEITPDFSNNVRDFPTPPASAPDLHDGTVRHWDGSLDHLIAADTSPDEDALREEEGVDPID